MLVSAILLCLYCSLFIDGALILPVKKIANILNEYCSSNFNSEALSGAINRSLVCGSKLSPSNSIKYYFSQLGVIHLLIASGAHLYFLKTCIKFCLKFTPIKNKTKNLILNLSLLLYVAVSGFNAPLLRAFIGLTALQSSQSNKLYWRGLTALLISISVSLLLNTQLWSSYSLILSWTVCCALSLNLKPLKKCIVIYVASLPVLLQFQWVHPISIFTNLIFAPVFSVIHFPLSFLSLFSTDLSSLSEFVWAYTLEIFKRIHQNIDSPTIKLNTPIYWLWGYCLALHISASLYSRHKNRKFYFS